MISATLTFVGLVGTLDSTRTTNQEQGRGSLQPLFSSPYPTSSPQRTDMPGYKPESKIGMVITKKYWAYDKDGKFKGEVKLTSQARQRYEEKFGMTFKTPSGSIY